MLLSAAGTDDPRIPVTAARVKLELHPVTLEAVYLPFFQPARHSFFGRDFSLLRPGMLEAVLGEVSAMLPSTGDTLVSAGEPLLYIKHSESQSPVTRTDEEGTMPDDPIRWWQSLTTAEAASFASRDPVAILPIAAIEQHGPHLPLSTDLDIGLGLLAAAFQQLPGDCPAWVLPPQALGASREHARFSGTISLEPEPLIAAIEAAGDALARDGVRRLVLCNSHGGNRPALDTAGL